MPLNNFSLISKNDTNNSQFIKQTAIWHHRCLPIKLCICHYQQFHYFPKLFQYYGIDKPKEISVSVAKRQAEFLAGRFAAREALEQLKIEAVSFDISLSKNRVPIWPQDISGSISHTSNVAASIVGKIDQIASVGIDIEDYLDDKTSTEIAAQIYNKNEYNLLAEQGLSKPVTTALIFSAKEALFKALYKYVNEFFGFESAQVVKIDIVKRVLQLKLDQAFSHKHQLNLTYHCDFALLESSVITLVQIPSAPHLV